MRIKEKNEILSLLNRVKLMLEYVEVSNKNELLYTIKESYNSVNLIIKSLIDEYDITKITYLLNKLNQYDYKCDITQKKESVKELICCIEKIIEDIDINIKVKIKAVFLPYKISMWTSLESIWKAANNDLECEAVVVPIPYHELDRDRNKEKIFYEGDLYPEDINIKRFWEYHIADEKPDMIFIHNPYDDINALTRVPVEYYSRNLKKYTDMLVYSPYHTFIKYSQTNHFCTIEGTKRADKILCQSESLKEQYVLNGHTEEKILVVGSPKIDAIKECINSNINIPYEWENKINGKKVFLLCTTLSFLSNFKEDAYERILNVCNNVTKLKNCILIWRPHPLEEIWIKNKNPDILQLYKQLVYKFENNKNIIIDRSEDCRPAFFISEAMFCSYTSLINEFMVTGKPILILQEETSEENDFLVSYKSNYYIDECDINEFINISLDKKDSLNKLRIKDIKESFVNFEDASCGIKTYNILKNEVVKKGL